MTKKHGIILAVVIVLAVLTWYGYKNWGWFGGTMNLRTAIERRGKPLAQRQVGGGCKQGSDTAVDCTSGCTGTWQMDSSGALICESNASAV